MENKKKMNDKLIKNAVFRIAVCLVLMWSMIGVFKDFFLTGTSYRPVYWGVLGVLLPVFSACYYLGGKYKFISFIPALGLLIGLILKLEAIIRGGTLLINDVIRAFNNYFRVDFAGIQVEGVITEKETVSFLIFFFGSMALITLFSILKGKSSFWIFMVTVPIWMAEILLGLLPDYKYFMPLVVCYLCIISVKRIQKDGSIALPAKVGMFVAVISTVIVLLISICVPEKLFTEDSKFLNQWTDYQLRISSTIKDKFFGRFFPENGVSKMNVETTSVNSRGGISGGDLENSGNISYDDATDFLITVNRPGTANYLKGYVGSRYTGRRWEMPNASDYESITGIFREQEAWRYVQSISYRLGLGGEENTGTGNIFIQNVSGSNKNTLIPYGANVTSEYSVDYDMTAGIDDDSYRFEYTPVEEFLFASRPRITTDTYASYRVFVYENYLDTEHMPERLKELCRQSTLYGTGADLQQLTSWIQNALWTDTEYSLSPGRLPDGRDFCDYFLFENKRGYCMHYATAAVLMFREFGIPSRYVEGYTLNGVDPDDNGNYTVSDRGAHAWPEVFVDNMGWLPVEVTPGFSTDGIGQEDEDSVGTETAATELTAEPQDARETPAVSQTQEIQTDQNEGESILQEESSVGTGISWIVKAAWFILLAGIILLVMVCRRIYGIYRRRHFLSDTSINKSILYAFSYFEALLACEGKAKRNDESYEAFAGRVVDTIHVFEFIQLVLKAGFSNEQMKPSEQKFAVAFVEDYARRYYGRLGGTRQIWLKYIKNLY